VLVDEREDVGLLHRHDVVGVDGFGGIGEADLLVELEGLFDAG